MKVMIALVSLVLSMSGAIAADQPKKAPSAAQLAQREKMKSCNAEATSKSLKSEERKKFMSECLKKGKATPTKPQEKMKKAS